MFALFALFPIALMTASVAVAPAAVLAVPVALTVGAPVATVVAAPVALTVGAPVATVVAAPVALAGYAGSAAPAEAESN